MLSWPALLIAPLLALAQQSIAYALVDPACASQSRVGLHAVSVIAIVLVATTVAMAWREWRRQAASLASDRAQAGEEHRAITAAEGHRAMHRPPFLALVSLLVGALSLLVAFALWLPIWFLSPCS